MTDKTQPSALPRYKIGYHSDEWGMRSSSPSGIPDPQGPWVRFEDAQKLIARVQQHEAELASIGAGGVSGPLFGQREPSHQRALENVALLADILNRRPAMNAGLVEAYGPWSSEVYDLMGAISAASANDDVLVAGADVQAAGVVIAMNAAPTAPHEAGRENSSGNRAINPSGHAYNG